MNGVYANMPDTRSRTSSGSSYRRPIRRFVASSLLFASSLLLVASMGLAQGGSGGANGATCEGLGSPEAALDYVANNPDAGSRLDGDGNGVPCDEEGLLAQTGDSGLGDSDSDFSSDSADEADEFEEELSNDAEDFEDVESGGTNDFSEEDPADSSSFSSGSATAVQPTPATGGVALLPFAGSVITAVCGGFVFLRRR